MRNLKLLSLVCLAFLLSGFTDELATAPRVVLTKANTLVMDQEFDGKAVTQVMLEARALHAKLPVDEPFYLVIDSPGGSIEAGLELITNLQALGRVVHTVSLFAASMGFQTAQGLGTRYLTPTGVYMSHKARGRISGEFPGQMDSRYRFHVRRVLKADETIVARSRGLLTLESYRASYENEMWCEGQDCVDFGVADSIAVVSCDKSLNGKRTTKVTVPFMGQEIEVAVTKAACPTITGILEIELASEKKRYKRTQIAALAEDMGLTTEQSAKLFNLLGETIDNITNKAVKYY